ncbi:glycoside hydrolase family 97 protein [Paludisphaera mucosa]|uniref:Glycoside hydrolase family 97 protein n=1 Tax=Paludisphaera mucosa TaxID=3030827 RepID=A0ABT6FCQ7_9BACT|nr:glycoside hydrolase family 97 protein [Paludisphaera mucosa]MDG3005346.1 glycoside hydrolase family 97 protein [Paludisphaera mucosa]
MAVRTRWTFLLALTIGLPAAARTDPIELRSPDGRLTVRVRVGGEGPPAFDVAFRGVPIAEGSLGLDLAGSGPLARGLRIVGERRRVVDETYAIPVGKASSARDRHNAVILSLVESAAPARRLDVEFRAFDDGVAFRYRIPEGGPIGDFVIVDELTRIAFPGAPTAHALPLDSFTTPYEKYYEAVPASAVGPDRLIGLPLLLERPGTAWIAVTEADLTDYAGLYLAGDASAPGTFRARLSPLPGRRDGAKVVGKAPHESPWRILMVADDPGRLLESNLIFHLSDPPAIADTSWIRPGKTTFPWWNGYAPGGAGPRPGVDTATMKAYIDFCAEQGIPYHSLDGLDVAWYGGPIQPDGPTDVTRSAPSIDMPELLRYAREKGVRLRLWLHWRALRPQIDEAFATYERWGVEGVMVDFMDRDDQEMVRFYHEMAEKAARRHLTLTLHGAYKPTGMERTWPNVLNYEAALNQEYNKWSADGSRGTPPSHNLDVAFIRMIAGPLDYHHGGMRNVLPEDFKFRNEAPLVQGTRGHQLAMYVVYLDPLPMTADTPAAYRGQPGLDFLRDVPTSWDETRVLHAEFGRCLVVARRKGDAWYLGGMTAVEGREPALDLGFLKGPHEADLWLDEPTGGPTALSRRRERVASGTPLKVRIPRDGGFVARLSPRPG